MTPSVPPGFTIQTIAHVAGARELAVAPNGDLFIGTGGEEVFVIAHPARTAAAPRVFVRIADAPVAGVTFTSATLIAGGQFGVYRVPYQDGDLHARAAAQRIARVRVNGESRDHVTTSVAFADGKLFASVGSSCDACDPELDNTRATIQMLDERGGIRPKAIHIRNAIALTVNPTTRTLWAGVAGQDELAPGHPYEIFDSVTRHAGVVDYGWPYCYENRTPVSPAHQCRDSAVPQVVFPAYETPIGAAFYPSQPRGAYVFPARYWGGAFVTLHGSWHMPPVPPRVVFVAMHRDRPDRPVDWNDPAKQWVEFMGGFQDAGGRRSARPTGIAVGREGELYVADDLAGNVYRIAPNGARHNAGR